MKLDKKQENAIKNNQGNEGYFHPVEKMKWKYKSRYFGKDLHLAEEGVAPYSTLSMSVIISVRFKL